VYSGSSVTKRKIGELGISQSLESEFLISSKSDVSEKETENVGQGKSSEALPVHPPFIDPDKSFECPGPSPTKTP
jgi:hypothetical protein